MVAWNELPPAEQKSLGAMRLPEFEDRPWVRGRPLAERRLAIVNTAGLVTRGERPFNAGDARYRTLPGDLPAAEILMSHVSVNFDRTGFQRDLESVLPRERLRALADEGVIGGVADAHYSFMGATEPEKMEPHARRLGQELLAGGVDSVLLLPV